MSIYHHLKKMTSFWNRKTSSSRSRSSSRNSRSRRKNKTRTRVDGGPMMKMTNQTWIRNWRLQKTSRRSRWRCKRNRRRDYIQERRRREKEEGLLCGQSKKGYLKRLYCLSRSNQEQQTSSPIEKCSAISIVSNSWIVGEVLEQRESRNR